MRRLRFAMILGILCWGIGMGVESQERSPDLKRPLPQDCQGTAAALDVTSTRMTFERQTRSFVFEENVRIRRCDMTILCDRLEVKSDATGQDVQHIVATGNVRVQQGTRHGTAERAEYFVADQRLVLTGNPRAWDAQKQHEMAGEEIVIVLPQEHVLVKRAHVLFHPRKPATKEP